MTFITSHFSLSFLNCHCFIKSRMVIQFTLKRTWMAKFHGNLSNCCPVGEIFHSGPLYCIPLLKAIALFIPIMSSLLRPLLPGPNTSSVWHMLCLEKFKHPSTGVNINSNEKKWEDVNNSSLTLTQYTVHTLNYLENMLWAPALYPGMIIWHILTQTQRWTHKVRMTQFHLARFTFLSEVSGKQSKRTEFMTHPFTACNGLTHQNTHSDKEVLWCYPLAYCGSHVFTSGDHLTHGGDVSSAVLCVFMIDLPPKSMRDLDSTTSGVPSYFPMRVAGIFM